jgi:hypothetical protein
MANKGGKDIRLIGVVFLVDFLLTMAILFSDRNLQTDFGITKPYFIHWYGLLITGLIALIGGIIILKRPDHKIFTTGAVGSILLALFLVSDIALYHEVGFSTPFQFAKYLFGVTKYPGSLTYIPGLYDALFALYIVTFALCLMGRHSAGRTT